MPTEAHQVYLEQSCAEYIAGHQITRHMPRVRSELERVVYATIVQVLFNVSIEAFEAMTPYERSIYYYEAFAHD